MPYELLDLPEPQQESTPAYLGRTAARTAARAGEAILGIPGNIAAGTVNAISALSGGRTPSHEQLTQQDIESGIPSFLQAPTSEHLRKGTKALTGEYLEPKTSGEESWDEIVSDAAPLFLGGTGGVVKKAAKSLGISTVGNLAKWGTEAVGGSPLAGSVAKLGSMVLAGTLGTRSELNDLKNNSYKSAFESIPENKKFNFSPEASTLENTLKKIKRSSIPDKQEVINRLEEFQNVLGKNGAGNVREVIGIKQGWNEHLRENGKNLARSAKREIEDAVSTVNSGINRYGKTNKAFWDPYIKGEELTAGLRDMDLVGKFISKHPALQKKMDNPFLGSLFKYGLGASAGGIITQYPLQIGGAVGGLYGLREASKAIKLLAKSPVARSAYKDAIQSAFQGNVANFGRDLSKLQSIYEKNSEDLEGRYVLLD